MNCFACERNLSAYLDDELPMDERLEIESHLDECERCRAEFESHQGAWEAGSAVPVGAAPEGLWRGIEAELEAEGPSTTLDDLALMMKGLASEIQDLRRSVDALNQQAEEAEWEERATAQAQGREVGDIRVSSKSFGLRRAREAAMDQVRRTS